jgi:hypothetical protein
VSVKVVATVGVAVDDVSVVVVAVNVDAGSIVNVSWLEVLVA